MRMTHKIVLTDDGFRVGVTEGGQGIPLVFLHGLSVSASAYTEMLELLAENGFHVYAFDAPDHGSSDSLPWGHTVKDMAKVIAEAMVQIPTLEGARIVAVGHSMGGWIATELAAMPRRSSWSIDDLILLDAAVGAEFHEGIRVNGVGGLLKGAQFLAGAARDVYGDARRGGNLRTLRERLSLISRLSSSVSGPGIARAINAMVRCDSYWALRDLRRNRVRTVIVHGEKDGIIPWRSALSASEVARATIIFLIGKFHSWMISDPQLALDVILDALDLTPNDEDVT